MDHIDQAKAASVWQRVHAGAPEPPKESGLGELIAREWEITNACLQLSRRFQGRDNALLRKLYQQEHSHLSCLKGIYTLITGQRPAFSGVPPRMDEPKKLLRRCYGQQMQNLARYEQRTSDPEFGHIFHRLAQQEQEHCQILLELIGNL